MVNHHPRTGDRITSAQLQHGREHARPTAPELFLFTGKKGTGIETAPTRCREHPKHGPDTGQKITMSDNGTRYCKQGSLFAVRRTPQNKPRYRDIFINLLIPTHQ